MFSEGVNCLGVIGLCQTVLETEFNKDVWRVSIGSQLISLRSIPGSITDG